MTYFKPEHLSCNPKLVAQYLKRVQELKMTPERYKRARIKINFLADINCISFEDAENLLELLEEKTS